MMRDVAMAVVAVTVSAYWLAVAFMVVRSWIRFRGPAGVIPKTRSERWMWLLWVPNTVAWIALPWLAWDQSRESPIGQLGSAVTSIRWLAALLAVAAFGLTTRCWLAMGSNWSMAVTPRKKTSLITGGAFGVVRHPIYALSLLLMWSTVVAVWDWPMLVVACIHAVMIVAKTTSEERYLRELHGHPYERYCRQTNRYVPYRYFFPRARDLSGGSPESGNSTTRPVSADL